MTAFTYLQIWARKTILLGVLTGLLTMMGIFLGHRLLPPASAAGPTPTPTPPFIPPHVQVLRAAHAQDRVSPLALYYPGHAPETTTFSWGGGVYALEWRDARLYVVQGGYFRVYDVRDPARPRLLEELLLVSNGGDVNGTTLRLADHRAYVTLGFYSGFGYSAMIDLDSSPPRVVATNLPVWSTGCNQDTVVFNLLSGDRMEVWDLSDPRHFRQLATASVVPPGYFLWECVVQDDVLYVSSSRGLTMVDVSDPTHPRPLGTFEADIYHQGNIAIQDGWAYVAANAFLHVVDVHDPSHPREVQRISSPYAIYGSDLIAQGDRLYRLTAESGGANRLTVYDITSPADIQQLTVAFLPDLYFSARMQINPEHVLFAPGRGGWMAYDLHDPDAITRISGVHLPTLAIALMRAGPCLILSAESTLATLVDGCDPRYPQPLWADTTLPTLTGAKLFRGAERFFIATPRHRNTKPTVRVYDHHDLRAPRFERQLIDMFQYEGGFAAWDSLLAGISPAGDRLRIIDLSRPPGHGLIYNGLLPDQSPQVLAAYNGMLFLQSRDDQGYRQLVQYDVSDPMHPQRTGSVRIVDLPAHQMLFYRNVAYLTVTRGSKTFLTLVRVSPHTPPQALGDFLPSAQGLGYHPWGERLGNQLVYSSGFKTDYKTIFQTWWIDVSDPVHPRVVHSRGGVGNPALLFEPYEYGVGPLLSARYLPRKGNWMRREVEKDALGPIYAVAAWGPDRVLVGGNGHLWVYDVTDPAQPQRLGETDAIGGLVYGIAVREDTAYLAVGDEGVVILSLADPTRPQVVRREKTASFAWNVSLAGWYLYVAEARGYAIYRVVPPHFTLFKQTSTPAWDMAPLDDIYAWGNASYVGVERFPGRFVFSDQGWTPGVAADARHIYAARGYEGVKVYDHDGANSRQYALPGYAMDLVPRGDRLFVVDWTGALHRLDLTAADAPAVDTLTFPTRAWGLALGERFLFVSLPQLGVAIVDPDTLAQVGLIALPTLQVSTAWAPDSSRVVMADARMLARFDLDHPDESTPWLTLPDTITALDGAGPWLYVAAGAKLYVISGAQAGPLTIVHTQTFAEPIRQVLAQPPNLYVLTGERMVHLLDIHTPDQPQELGHFETTARVRDMAASGRVLYLAQGDRLVRTIDWEDPAQPQVVNELITAQTPVQLEVDGEALIFKESAGGYDTPDEDFSIFDIRDPRAPRYRFAIPATKTVRRMALRDGRLAVIYEDDRVSLYEVDMQGKQFIYLSTGMEPPGHTEMAIPLGETLITLSTSGDLRRFRLPPKQLWMPRMLQERGR